MPTFEYDFHFLHAGVEQLESYLLAKDIYRPAGVKAPAGEPPYPQLTLGALLLAKERVKVSVQTSRQQADLDRLLNELETIRSKWRSAWGRKASTEFRARLNLWADFLHEYRTHPEAHDDRYAYEVSRRVMLQLLHPDTLDLPEADVDLLAALDILHKAVFSAGEFIWEEDLKTAFPENPYWYLYGKLPKALAYNQLSD
jgi:hypothetical protein